METFSPDYAKFHIDANGMVIPGERMKKKIDAIPFPDLKDRKVLDIGCDYGQFSFFCANKGARKVVGLDRNREVRGIGKVDLIANNNYISEKFPNLKNCFFKEINLGKQWLDFGKFDVILMMSMYHHVYQNVGEHEPIWFWLWTQCHKNGQVIWENPVDLQDAVSCRHIEGEKRNNYTKEKIVEAASKYFDVEYVGNALHEPHREVFIFTKKELEFKSIMGIVKEGANGATKAFLYKEGRRIKEINNILGYEPYPGSLNVTIPAAFDWDSGYFRVDILDVVERGKGLDTDWKLRKARLYPIEINKWRGHIFRFEGEKYPLNFIEIISPVKLRQFILNEVEIKRWG